MKDTFTSWLLKILAVTLSFLDFIGLMIWGLSFSSDMEDIFGAAFGVGFFIGALLISVLTFCLLYGFAEHLKHIAYISDRIEKFDICLDAYVDALREKSEDKVELEVYGDLNKMSL